MSIFGPFFRVDEKVSPWEVGSERIMDHALNETAKDLQHRVRSRLDSGVDLRAAIRARTVTVRNEMGDLVIKSADAEGSGDNTTVNDLFQAAMITPSVEGNKVIFRAIREEQLSERNTAAIKGAFTETMGLQFKNNLEDGVRRVIAETPQLR